MALDYLSKQVDFAIAHNVFSTGGTTVGNVIDTQGYDGVCLLTTVGLSTATVTVTALGSATTGSFQALANASVASTAANRMTCIDLLKPGFRYIQVSIAATGITHSGVCTAIKYHPHAKPVTNSSDLIEVDRILNATT